MTPIRRFGYTEYTSPYEKWKQAIAWLYYELLEACIFYVCMHPRALEKVQVVIANVIV